MQSQLAYYSKLHGPQVLLQLNIAYYVPSIPVLLLMGRLERLLDETLGPTASIALRLSAGAQRSSSWRHRLIAPHLRSRWRRSQRPPCCWPCFC